MDAGLGFRTRAGVLCVPEYTGNDTVNDAL